MGGVVTRAYELPAVNVGEVLRYAGAPRAADEFSKLVESCLCEAEHAVTGRVCFAEVGVSRRDGRLSTEAFETESVALSKNLAGCDRAVIFAATVGFGIDRLIAKYSVVSPSRALIFQAVGAERIEALCDTLCLDLEREYGGLRPRFSPGYGDLPLAMQREIFAYLDCPKRIGLTLNESLLMSPTKSVTAIVGITNKQ